MMSDIHTPTADQPKVLVLLATYNGALWLPEQLASILSQEGVSLQVIVTDDCSRDGTVQIVTEAVRQDARVSLVTWDAGSGSAGGNFRRIFRHAGGKGSILSHWPTKMTYGHLAN